MNKENNPKRSRLNLNKKTISNLSASEMNRPVGGARHTYGCEITDYCTRRGNTCNGHTCNGNNQCIWISWSSIPVIDRVLFADFFRAKRKIPFLQKRNGIFFWFVMVVPEVLYKLHKSLNNKLYVLKNFGDVLNNGYPSDLIPSFHCPIRFLNIDFT